MNGVSATYDASGNMTNDGQNSLVYDGENHAVSATVTGSSSGAAAASQGIPTELLAAIGIRETGFQNMTGDYGHGHGIFQLDDRWNPPSVIAVAYNPSAAANIAGGKLATNLNFYASQGIGGLGKYAAAVRDYNASPGADHGKVWRLGAMAASEAQRPYWLDVGTANGNYVSNVLAIALNCF